jgi:hypothetical protein
MLGSMNDETTGSGGLNRPNQTHEYWHGRWVECELCQTEQQCFDRYGLVTCQTCHTEFLPSGGVLYRG